MFEIIILIGVALYILNMARFTQGKHVALKIPIAILYLAFCYGIYLLPALIIGFVAGVAAALRGTEPPFTAISIIGGIAGFSTFIPTLWLGRRLFRKLNYEEGKPIPFQFGG